MLKKLITAAGMVLLVSSFALAGQTPTKPVEQPKVAQSPQGQTNTKAPSAKKHHKHHKKHHAQASKK
jgi:hypothetical protein